MRRTRSLSSGSAVVWYRNRMLLTLSLQFLNMSFLRFHDVADASLPRLRR